MGFGVGLDLAEGMEFGEDIESKEACLIDDEQRLDFSLDQFVNALADDAEDTEQSGAGKAFGLLSRAVLPSTAKVGPCMISLHQSLAFEQAPDGAFAKCCSGSITPRCRAVRLRVCTRALGISRRSPINASGLWIHSPSRAAIAAAVGMERFEPLAAFVVGAESKNGSLLAKDGFGWRTESVTGERISPPKAVPALPDLASSG
jgi:hypothetical protein